MKRNKFEKVLNIVLFSLLSLFGLYVLVSFIINKDGTMYWINYVVDLLNKPLPIVGVTTFAVLLFVWRLAYATRYGKKALEKIEQTYQEKYDALLNQKDKVDNTLCQTKEITCKLSNGFVEVCSIIPNVKVNQLGENMRKELQFYGESKDSETETK